MNKEYVLVRHTFSDNLGKAMVERGYSCCLMYKNNKSFIHRTLRRICHKLHLPFEQFWFDKSILNHDGKIVVFEPLCTPTYMKWLRKNKPHADIVFWYWNIAKNTVSPDDIKPEWCRKWSFARLDCQKYGMNFNPLPYFHELILEPQNKDYDIIFVGKDKGRLPALLDLKETFIKMGLKVKFIISPTNNYTKNPEYSPAISYIESVRLGMQSKAILDYIEINNSGQSIRVIESLFQKEKIITNSILISDYDFYYPENIFVLGRDKLENLPSFLNTPYKEIDSQIVKQYDFDCVIKRFFESDGYSEKMMKHIGDIN